MAATTLRNMFALGLISIATVTAAQLDVDQARSKIQVDVSSTGHNFTGTLEKFSAQGSGDKGSLDVAGFELQWNFKNLKTGDAKRDEEMLRWLGGGDPKGTFKFSKSWKEKDGSSKAMGTLTINGVAQTIAFPFTIQADGEWITVDGRAGLDYKLHKLPIIRTMGLLTVDPNLVVRFHVVGKVR